jgi:mannose-6-phosphate isomerase-like protein (cupin superfamily)
MKFTQRVLAVICLLLTGLSAHAAERKVDPSFVHRNNKTLAEVVSDVTTSTCHFKPMFGEGGAALGKGAGVSRFAEVVVDPHGSCKSVSYAGEDQIYVVLQGHGAVSYGGQTVVLANEDFLYIPATISHALSNDTGAPMTVAVMGYNTDGFPAGPLPSRPLKDNIANVPLEHVGSHPESAHYRLLLGDSGQTRDRIDVGSVVTSLFLMEIDPGGTNFPHHHPREEEIYLILSGHGTQVAGSGVDGVEGRFPAGVGDAYYYRPNTTVGYYSAPDVGSRILCIRSWWPGMQLPRKAK